VGGKLSDTLGCIEHPNASIQFRGLIGFEIETAQQERNTRSQTLYDLAER
jgi:hypothetical protein